MKIIRRLPTHIICAIVAIVLLVVNHAIYSPLAAEFPAKESLNVFEKESLSTIFGMTELLISLCTALFGGICYFMLEHYKIEKKINKGHRLHFVVAVCASILSIDCGYIFMEKMSELLALRIFNIEDKLITIPKTFQIIYFIISLIFTGTLVLKISFQDET